MQKVKMSFEDYLKNPAVGQSSLKVMIEQSPAHYLYQRENPSKSTPAKRLGTILHQAILEPKLFNELAVVEPEFSGKGSRAEKDAWLLENHGKTILDRKDLDMVQGILKSISSHKKASQLISEGRAEESIFWKDPETGIDCKGRPDFFREKHQIVDIKSTTDANYKPFQKDIGTLLYHFQAAFYLDGASQVFGRKFDEFIIVAVEKTPPYAINCYLLEESAINEGRALYYNALKILAECIKSGNYPGYPQTLNSIDLRSWDYRGEQ